MIVIGLTGQTGAGKGMVSEILMQHGFYHIDADKIAHSVYEKGSDTINELVMLFGDEILNDDGEINRRKLAEKAFKDANSTRLLNSVVHPEVTKKIKRIIDEQRLNNTKAVVLDAIALFESGEDKLCDFIAAVTAPESIRKERIILRDGISETQADERISAQNDEEFYREKADIVIENYPPHNLTDEVNKILLWIDR